MARKKVDLTYITNDSKRRATLKKRKNGLIKKIDEIGILCGIEACAIIYTPDDPQLEVCPSDQGVQNVLSRFRQVSELEQSKKMLSQESFLSEKIVKAQAQLKKLSNGIKKKETTLLMFQYLNAGHIFNNANMNDLNNISRLIEQNLGEIERKNNISQVQEVTPNVKNGGVTVTHRKQTIMNHVHGLETNVMPCKTTFSLWP
ncbi:agamous-like MADS-box protein AGL80 [Cajanus cajan]|uniref:Agamous-like MADS-box protein AGL80 n=1 Tax=Cajanus cajan TaxID=3821 RepID=A0A151QUR7_CAJCA|nr:agamous-like MADS-box protein AGL80 [Cajanus cajan]KYP34087.1 Agamous-like MADS-box protein AGL80 [Cajanus cajan]